MEYIFAIILLTISAIAVPIVNRVWMMASTKTTYVCDLCDDHHCECIRK